MKKKAPPLLWYRSKLFKKMALLLFCLALTVIFQFSKMNPQKLVSCTRDIKDLEDVKKSFPLKLSMQYAAASRVLSCLDRTHEGFSAPKTLLLWRTLSEIVFNSGNTLLYFESKFINQDPSNLGGNMNDILIHIERLCWHYRMNGRYSACSSLIDDKIASNDSKKLRILRSVEIARNELYLGNIKLSRMSLFSLLEKMNPDDWMYPWILFHISETFLADHSWKKAETFLWNFQNEIAKKKDSLSFLKESYGNLALVFLFRNKGDYKKSFSMALKIKSEFERQTIGYPSSIMLWLQFELFLNSAILKEHRLANEILVEIQKNLDSASFSKQEIMTAELYKNCYLLKSVNQSPLLQIKQIFGEKSPKYIEIKNNCENLIL